MPEASNKAERLLGGERTFIDYICETAAADGAENADEARPSDLAYWQSVRDAKKNGRKLIFINGPVPTEILYALECVPLCLDLLPARIAQDEALTAALINDAEIKGNSDLCSLSKTATGVLLSGRLGLEPDAYVSLPIPCDSARAACTELTRFIDAPSFHFDIPLRHDPRNVRYIALQFERLIAFLENITGGGLDWEKVRQRMALYNRSAELLQSCAELRMHRPCPLSSRLTVWNELMNAFGPTAEMGALLEKELALCQKRIDAGFSPCPQGEKHRVLILHNLVWQTFALTERLENAYGAVTVLDGFCLGARERFTDPDDRAACIALMCRRMSTGAMAHGTGAAGEDILSALARLLPDYAPDVFVFLGSKNCRHHWAAMKMVADTLQETYGFPLLQLDIDNTFSRYKPLKDIGDAISEYMDTVVEKK